MAWDKYDTEWAIKFLAVALVWYGSIVCVSFSMFAHYPVISYHVVCTLMVCFTLFYPAEIHKKITKPTCSRKLDYVGIGLDVAFWCFMTWIGVKMMIVIHTGADLPDNIINNEWTQKWWGFLVYMGAWLCPIIYFSVRHQERKEKKEIERLRARQARRQREFEERMAMLKRRNELGLP